MPMVLCQYSLLLAAIVRISFGEMNISTIFLQAFADGNMFNVTKFDEIFPSIKHDQTKWVPRTSMVNITANCAIVNNYTKWSIRKYFDIINQTDVALLTSYLHAKFLNSSCQDVKTDEKSKKFSLVQVWIYGLLTVTFINSTALLGIVLMPLIKKSYYNAVMTFMVSLAVGSLAGTAILILIPESMKISEMVLHGNFPKNDYKWKATTVFAGLYMFFLAERLIKIVIYRKGKDISPRCGAHGDNLALQAKGDTSQSIDNNIPSGTANEPNEVGTVKRKVDPVAWMIVFGDGLHNFVDGLSIGAAFSSDVLTGISVSVAIMCEELPHELGDFAILISSGMTFKRAMFWNSMSAMTCYLGFIIGAIVGEVTSAAVWIFAIAGGMFLYISLVDMVNDIIATLDNMTCSRSKKFATFALQNIGLWAGYAVILIVSLYGDKIQFGG